jgi:hypothetical protein
MKNFNCLAVLILAASACGPAIAAGAETASGYKLKNPMTQDYLKEHLRKEKPRLLLTRENEAILREKLQTDPLVQARYKSIKEEAFQKMREPLLERKITDGKRLLSVSGEMMDRMNCMCLAYRVERDSALLARIDKELRAVCAFSDWNPSHYLDVAIMSQAVALVLDWAGEALPESTVELATTALIEKGIRPSYSGFDEWVDKSNNWNAVCHSGMIAAAIAIAEKDPKLASKTIARALDKMNLLLSNYDPDGVYPEGPGYWGMATGYAVLASSMLSSAFGTDFGIADFPGFLNSADYRMLMVGASGEYFNYGDCGSNLSEPGRNQLPAAWFNNGGAVNIFVWFALKTGNSLYFDRSYFAREPGDTRGGGFGVPALLWLSQYQPGPKRPLPLAWVGKGTTSVAVFRGGTNDPESDPDKYYFAAKGGTANFNHSNMDAGSFVFELDGIRWALDPGSQGYEKLEQAGFGLWDLGQKSERWALLNKGNQGHNTLTVNDARHNVEGMSRITGYQLGDSPEVTFDLTEIFRGQLDGASRRFIKEGRRALRIEDSIVRTDSTKTVTWQLMTRAMVHPVEEGATLKQGGRELKLEILSPKNLNISVISLFPPPLKYDKLMKDLKRIEIRIPAWTLGKRENKIIVRLSGT